MCTVYPVSVISAMQRQTFARVIFANRPHIASVAAGTPTQIYDKWVANIPKRVGFSFSPSLAATFNLTGFNGSDFGSGPRSPEESPGGATEGNTGPTAGAAVTGIVARCRHQLYSVGLVSSRSELPLSLMM